MRAIPTILAGALLSSTMIPGAMAAVRRPINAREHHEQVRIRQGVKSGELTRRETLRLEKEQARIRVNERFARKSGGEFNAAERARIQKELNRASRDIYKQKHDKQDRN